MSFFKNFPLIQYKFGDEVNSTLFQNISAYIDLIDQVKDDGSFYEYYDIIDGDRPDTVSYKLYGTTDYYWTFYFLNDSLRTRGWPLTEQELEEEAPQYYPHTIITTQEEMFNYFKVGQTVVSIDDNLSQEQIEDGVATGQQFWNDYVGRGVIIERDLDLGQITIQADTGIESINIVNPGGGYYRSPVITISNGEGSGATASATVDSDGFISEIELVTRGSNYINNPTVTISEPDLVNWQSFSNALTEYVDNGGVLGTYLEDSNYINLIETTFDGYLLGDINNDGSVDSDDLSIIDAYVLNPNSIKSIDKTWIEQVIKPEIVSNNAFLGNLFPGGEYSKVQATATATRYDPTDKFKLAKWIFTEDDTYETNVGLWTLNDVRWNAVFTSRDQINAIHHWEDTEGNWVDIDPFNQSGTGSSTIGRIGVTYYDRLKANNDELKRIKVFRPSIVDQINTEYKKQLRNSRNG